MTMGAGPGGWHSMRSFSRDRSVTATKLPKGTFRRIIRFATPYRRLIVVLLGLLAVDSVIGVINPLLYRDIINEGILGKSVYSAANEDMGRVVDVIVKRTGEVRAVVIDFGGFLGVGSRTIAVDWSALRFPKSGPMDHIILELTRDQVRLAPEYKPGEPLVVLGLGDVQPHPETSAPEH